MPEVSRFFGISIRMYFDDHNPPHFHAIHGSHEVQVRIDPAVVLRGSLPRHAQRMVLDWAVVHRQELLDNWDRLRNNALPTMIDPWTRS